MFRNDAFRLGLRIPNSVSRIPKMLTQNASSCEGRGGMDTGVSMVNWGPTWRGLASDRPVPLWNMRVHSHRAKAGITTDPRSTRRTSEASGRQRSTRTMPRDPGPLIPNPMRPLLRPSQSILKPARSLLKMSRRERSSSAPSSPREAKRPRLEAPLTSDDYKNGIMLAPMVRSGACKFKTSVGYSFGFVHAVLF